jgi:DNA primase catalytic core
MSLHKLSAGDGYTYLVRQVAAGDSTERGYDSLGDYYSAKGETPGRWVGSGVPALNMSPASSGSVSEAQMKALFGLGLHPDADEIVKAKIAAGEGPVAAQAATRLGAAYRVVEGNPQWRERLSERYRAWNTVRGLPERDPVPSAERERIRTDTALELFQEQHRREPLHDGELSGFLAQQSRLESASVAGFDLTFSPVKSVSSLWAVAGPAVSAQIEAAHAAAVAQTLAHLEATAVYTRLGRNGVRQVDVTGLIAAQFTHRDSRAGDPDLHTHVAIANKVQTLDGRWMALDGRMIYRAAVTASEFYNTALEAEITARIGGRFAPRQTAPGKRPIRELAGVDDQLMRRWSTRRQAIEAATGDLAAQFVAAHGRVPTAVETLRLAQQATLATRQAKHEPRSLAEQRRVWHAQAVQVLGGEPRLAAMLRDVRATVVAAPITAGLVDELAAETLDTVSASRARWREANLHAEAIRQVRAVGIDPAMVLQQAAMVTRRAMAADHSIAIGVDTDITPDERVPAQLRRADGTSQFRVAGGQQFTSPVVLDAERRIIATAGRVDARTISAGDVELAMLEWSANNAGRTLNTGQAQLVRDIATTGRRVHLALAPAGTGKTTVMGVLARAWQASGGTVIGLAPQASAAEELRAALPAVDTDTVDKLVHEITQGDPQHRPQWIHRIGADSLVIVDEAGLASTRNLDATIAYVTGRGGRVLLVGDDRQRAAAGAGGVLRDIDAAYGSSSLVEVMRFDDPTEGQATLAVRDGDPAAAGFYTDRGRLHAVTADTAIATLYTAWAADITVGRQSIMIAPTLDQVSQLNALARAARLAALPSDPRRGPELTLPNGDVVSAGDTVISKRNARTISLGGTDFVQNNHRWTVLEVHRDRSLTVQLVGGADRRQVRLPAWYVADGHVRLGYADTLASVQGRTVGAAARVQGTAHVLIDAGMTRNELYVGLSRAVTANHLYISSGGGINPDQVITPDAVHTPTAAEVFALILGRDGSDRSATTEIRDAADPAKILGHAAPAYREAIVAAGEAILGPDRVAAITDGAEAAVPGVTTAPAWDTLRGHLITIALAGDDPITRLAGAAADRELDTAVDLAAVLDWRLDATGNHSQAAGPLPWLPAVPTAAREHPEFGPYLGAWTNRVTDQVTAITAAVSGWTAATAPAWATPYLSDRDLVTTLALWRASDNIPDTDLRPAGPVPPRLADRRRRRELLTACARVAGVPGDGADRWARVLTGLGVDAAAVTRDDYWPVLVGRLNLADAAGLRVDQFLTAAARQQPLPAEAVASALWWRLAPHLGATTIPTGAGQHRVRPPWTDRLAEHLGRPAADRITGDRLWPVLVAAVDAAARDTGAPADRLVDAAAGLLAPAAAHLPEHSWATALLGHVTDLAAPTPPIDPDHDRIPPDPADAELLPPTDLHQDAPEPDPRTPGPADADTPPVDRPLPVEPVADPGPDPDTVAEPEPTDIEQAAVRARAHVAVAAAWDFYRQQAPRSWAPGYLAGRGLDTGAGDLGYAPAGWTALVEHLRAAGHSDTDLLAAGLARTSRRGTLIDTFRDRLILPIYDAAGNVTAFVGRGHPGAPDGTPKYLNSPGTVVFDKSELPYGLAPDAVDRYRGGAELVIVEGPMDVLAVNIAARRAGRDATAVAPLGTALTAGQLHTMNRIAPLADRKILLALDNDPPGNRAAAKAHSILGAAGVTTAQVPRLPAGFDPADLLTRDGVEELIAALGQRKPLADLLIDHYLDQQRLDDTAESRVWALNVIAPIIAALPGRQRVRQAHRAARRIGIDPFRMLDTIHQHIPYDPTPRGQLGLPTPPRLRSYQQDLAVIGQKIARLAEGAEGTTAPQPTQRSADPREPRTPDRERGL